MNSKSELLDSNVSAHFVIALNVPAHVLPTDIHRINQYFRVAMI